MSGSAGPARGARLEGASLEEARMEGANVLDSDFRQSDWADASNQAPAHFADLHVQRI